MIALTLLLAIPQLAGSQAGTCRKGPNWGAPESKCDPNLWNEYERRKKVAEELFKTAAAKRKTGKDEAAEFYKEQPIGMGEVSAVKGPPVAAAGKLRQLALRYVGSTLSNMEEKMAALKQAKAFGAVEFGAEEIGGVLGTGLWVTVQGMEIQQLNANWADGEKMSAEAQRQLDKALEAFKADFNQREACEKDRQKLAGEERLADKAKQLMEEWENNGNCIKIHPVRSWTQGRRSSGPRKFCQHRRPEWMRYRAFGSQRMTDNNNTERSPSPGSSLRPPSKR